LHSKSQRPQLALNPWMKSTLPPGHITFKINVTINTQFFNSTELIYHEYPNASWHLSNTYPIILWRLSYITITESFP
jgi:hypothetical protein